MTELTYKEYSDEISSIASDLAMRAMTETDNDINDALELINDSMLHEEIDGHQWVIYYAYNLDVMEHSNNKDYYADNFGAGDMCESLNQGGIDGLHAAIAFWCMHADVQDNLNEALNDYYNENDQ